VKIGRRRDEMMANSRSRAGPRIYSLPLSQVETMTDLAKELARIGAMGFNWIYINLSREFTASGQSPENQGSFHHAGHALGMSADEETRLRHFAAEAITIGLNVMIDLAGDFSLADRERPVDRLIGYGVRGFCCAAAETRTEKLRALIDHAKAIRPDCVFIADALGRNPEVIQAIGAAGFDFHFNSFAWWDLKSSWALAQYDELRLIAPSIAFPESNHTIRSAAQFDGKSGEAMAADLKLRYGLAALFSTGILMPTGYEWGYHCLLRGTDESPLRSEPKGVDISGFVTAINQLRHSLPATNVEGAQFRLGAPDSPHLALLRVDAGHVLSAQHGTLVVANPVADDTVLAASQLISQAGGLFDELMDVTPGEPRAALVPGSTLTLGAGELRVFAAIRHRRKIRARLVPPNGKGRVLIENVWPQIDHGRTPVKRIVGEVVEVWADIVGDGHDILAAELLYRTVVDTKWRRAPMKIFDNDRWTGSFPLDENDCYLFTIEAWRDPFASWCDEIRKKQSAGQELSVETLEGVLIAERAAARAVGADAARMSELLVRIVSQPDGSPAQRKLLLDEHNVALIARCAERENLSRYDRILTVMADRLAARFSAWYELFPRSQSGNREQHGTFEDVVARLDYVRGMGFDVLYLPPIHPIGRTNRKGRNNAVSAEPSDVGSVYAIGDETGGHEAIHPQLGTHAQFRRLVAAAHDHGLEVALDFAIQCSPDHPWIKQHPEWFDWRPDGTLKYAENPPKKYEDIVNVHFYGDSLPSLWIALRDVVLFWVGEGVRIFRVDNPHTKPLPFWRWLIREVNERHSDVLFLSEAFTRPKMMKALAKLGFQQSYTYFTWRNTKQELTEYVTELAHSEMREYYRPNFFVNTPDINPYYLQKSGRAGFIVRSTLAATLASAWGIYSGFELCEATPISGREEYLDSEKYELKARDWDRPDNIRSHISALNAIRRANIALHDFRNVTFLNAWNDEILVYVRMTPRRDNCVMVLVNLDPHHRQECNFEVPLWEFGLPDDGMIQAEDLLEGGSFSLRGKIQRIALDPADRPVMIWRLLAPQRQEVRP
jgi:starch synthase (maltosyl-transferring)